MRSLLLTFLLLSLTSCGVVATGLAAGNAVAISNINRRLSTFEILEMDRDLSAQMHAPDSETITLSDEVFKDGEPNKTRDDSYAVLVPTHKHAGVLLRWASTRETMRTIPEKFSYLMRVARKKNGGYSFRVPAGSYRALIVNSRLVKRLNGSEVELTLAPSFYTTSLRTGDAKIPSATRLRSSAKWSNGGEELTTLHAQLPELERPEGPTFKRMTRY